MLNMFQHLTFLPKSETLNPVQGDQKRLTRHRELSKEARRSNHLCMDCFFASLIAMTKMEKCLISKCIRY